MCTALLSLAPRPGYLALQRCCCCFPVSTMSQGQEIEQRPARESMFHGSCAPEVSHYCQHCTCPFCASRQAASDDFEPQMHASDLEEGPEAHEADFEAS